MHLLHKVEAFILWLEHGKDKLKTAMKRLTFTLDILNRRDWAKLRFNYGLVLSFTWIRLKQ